MTALKTTCAALLVLTTLASPAMARRLIIVRSSATITTTTTTTWANPSYEDMIDHEYLQEQRELQRQEEADKKRGKKPPAVAKRNAKHDCDAPVNPRRDAKECMKRYPKDAGYPNGYDPTVDRR